MYLLNISRENERTFSRLFSKIEQRSGLFFLFAFGLGTDTSRAYIQEYVTILQDNGEIPRDVKVLPIVINGYPGDENYSVRPAPSFANDIDSLNSIPRGESVMFLSKTLPTKHKHIPRKLVLPIESPSGSRFGDVILPKDKTELFPIVYLYYNFFDIVDMNKETERVFKYLVSKACSMLIPSFRKPAYRQSNSIPDISGKMTDLLGDKARRIKEKRDGRMAKVEELKAQMINELRELKDLDAILSSQFNTEYIQGQIEIIRSLPEVRWVDIEGKFLKVLVEGITIETEIEGVERKFDIGDIIMKVNMNNGTVYFDNITRRCKGYSTNSASHPHDASSGSNNMCLGQINSTIPEMINEMELATMVRLLINYAKSVNLGDSAGKYISKWPEITE